jgi:hypothetical protein
MIAVTQAENFGYTCKKIAIWKVEGKSDDSRGAQIWKSRRSFIRAEVWNQANFRR